MVGGLDASFEVTYAFKVGDLLNNGMVGGTLDTLPSARVANACRSRPAKTS